MTRNTPSAVHRSILSEIVERELHTIAEAYRNGSQVYESLARTGQKIAANYGDRFLIELIQNAHDAHDARGRDGEICVLLDAADSQHGTLFLANRGNGFTKDNVNALRNLGLSNKPVGEGIGNKGLGFRSVFQITNDPQVFSVAGPLLLVNASMGSAFASRGGRRSRRYLSIWASNLT